MWSDHGEVGDDIHLRTPGGAWAASGLSELEERRSSSHPVEDLEPEPEPEPDPGQAVLDWLLEHCFGGSGGVPISLKELVGRASRKFIILAWQLRPGLFPRSTNMTSLAKALNVSKACISRLALANTDGVGIPSPTAKPPTARATYSKIQRKSAWGTRRDRYGPSGTPPKPTKSTTTTDTESMPQFPSEESHEQLAARVLRETAQRSAEAKEFAAQSQDGARKSIAAAIRSERAADRAERAADRAEGE